VRACEHNTQTGARSQHRVWLPIQRRSQGGWPRVSLDARQVGEGEQYSTALFEVQFFHRGFTFDRRVSLFYMHPCDALTRLQRLVGSAA